LSGGGGGGGGGGGWGAYQGRALHYGAESRKLDLEVTCAMASSLRISGSVDSPTKKKIRRGKKKRIERTP